MTSNHHAGPHDQVPHSSNRQSSAGESHDFDALWWEQHYQDGATGSVGQPGAQLVAEVAGLSPGTALDAGCGTGADAVWLARQGWDVTAVDVSPTAVQRARTIAARDEPDLAGRLSWLVADLADLAGWQPPRQYDLVISQYVHPDLPFGDFVARLADAVGPGGTLLVVGHDRSDSHSAAHAPRPASIGVEAVLGALDPDQWQIAVAETRTRQVSRGTTRLSVADLVIRACRTR